MSGHGFRAEAMLDVMMERGYLVLMSEDPLPLGYTLLGIEETSAHEQPFVVMAKTDYADFLAQGVLFCQKTGRTLGPSPDPSAFNFYRVTTD